MKAWQGGLSHLVRFSERLVPYIIVVLGIPLLVLLIAGLIAIYQQGYWLLFVALIALCTFLALIPLHFMRQKAKHTMIADAQTDWVQVSKQWGQGDITLWNELNTIIEQQLQDDNQWHLLRTYALSLIAKVAQHYRPAHKYKKWAFTLPEALKMTEEVSKRYRVLVKTHVPLAENLNLSTLGVLYDHRDKYKTGSKIWQGYRFLRSFTPAGLVAELRAQVLDKVFSGLSHEIQFTLKRALLQEVVSVAIDLYSGQFKVDDEELGISSTYQADQAHLAVLPEPLRVSLIGQVSAGKSSIVNALLGSIVAEVNQMPSTRQATIYTGKLNGVETIAFVDLPGLDGTEVTNQYLFEQMIQSDIILWVLKANQSARALDTQFKTRLNQWLAQPKQLSRRLPVLIGILNQVDRLPPIHEWQPPYDLAQPQTPKAKTIRAALDYNQQLLGLQEIIPLAVGEANPNPYNLTALQLLLDQYYAQGLQAQLSRRRLQAVQQTSLQDQFKRLYKMGSSLFNNFKPT